MKGAHKLEKQLQRFSEIIHSLYSFINELDISDDYKRIIFEKLLDLALSSNSVKSELISVISLSKPIKPEEKIPKVEMEEITFPEFITKFDLEKIKFHYQRVVILMNYLSTIKGKQMVDNLLDMIQEYFPKVLWKIPANLRRDTYIAYKKGYIICKEPRNMSKCYLSQKGIQLINDLLK